MFVTCVRAPATSPPPTCRRVWRRRTVGWCKHPALRPLRLAAGGGTPLPAVSCNRLNVCCGSTLWTHGWQGLDRGLSPVCPAAPGAPTRCPRHRLLAATWCQLFVPVCRVGDGAVWSHSVCLAGCAREQHWLVLLVAGCCPPEHVDGCAHVFGGVSWRPRCVRRVCVHARRLAALSAGTCWVHMPQRALACVALAAPPGLVTLAGAACCRCECKCARTRLVCLSVALRFFVVAVTTPTHCACTEGGAKAQPLLGVVLGELYGCVCMCG